MMYIEYWLGEKVHLGLRKNIYIHIIFSSLKGKGIFSEVFLCINAHIYIYIHININMHVCVCVCVYIYIYIYTHTYEIFENFCFCVCICTYGQIKNGRKGKQFSNISSVKAGSRSHSDQEITDNLPSPIYHF